MKLDNLKYYLIIASLHLLALLPLRALYMLSDGVCFIIHRIVGYRVEIVRKNLKETFPDKSEKELRAIERRFYHYLCDCIVETVKLLHISDRQLKRRVTLTNSELVYELQAKGRPIILFLGHYNNWEWVPAMTLTLRQPQTMGALYQPLHSRVMNRVMLRLRSRFSSKCIPTKTAYRRLLELRRINPSFMIGFIADQRPLGSSVRYWTNFLGRPTAFVVGGETIGERVDANYLYVENLRLGRGRYNLNFKLMNLDDLKADKTLVVRSLHPNSTDDSHPSDGLTYPYTRLFLQMLEETIRTNPPYWLWSHNRWADRFPEK